MLEFGVVRPVVALGCLFAAFGCGDVVFVDPDAALKSELVLVEAQRLNIEGDPRTYLHVRIGGRRGLDLVRLSARGVDGTIALPLADAHRQDCGAGQTCLSLTLGTGEIGALTELVLDAPDIGHRHARRIVEHDLRGYELVAEAAPLNAGVSLHVQDPLRLHFLGFETTDDGRRVVLFPRRFEALVAPGACGDPISPQSDDWELLDALPATVDAAFDDGALPATCVAVRPAEPAGGGSIAERTVRAGAVVRTFQHTYVPPTELSPLVYLPIFNLELPSEARCTEAQMLVGSAIRDAAIDIAASVTGGGTPHELSVVDLATKDGAPCRQLDAAWFDADALHQQVLDALRSAYGPEQRVRVVVVYVTNLRVPTPPTLSSAFTLLRARFAIDERYADFVVAIAPEEAVAALDSDRVIPWLATEEPTFRQSIRSELATSWPFKTSVHTSATVVPLTSDEDPVDVLYYRICGAVTLRPLGTPVFGSALGDPLAPPPEGPAYVVDLPDQTLEPAQTFVAPAVRVRWEGCEDLCDRPVPGDPSGLPWLMTNGC